MKRRLPLALLGLLALMQAVPARAYVPEQTPRREVEATARRALASAPARGSFPAVLITRGGRQILGFNADVPLVPASLMKLATTTAALARLGPNHRFTTRVMASGPGPTVPMLYLVGGGDPTFATEAYRRDKYLPAPNDPAPIPVFAGGSPTVEGLAARVAAAGVRRIAGDLVVDDTMFDGQRVQPGWIQRYLVGSPDIGLLSALAINEGFTDVTRLALAPAPALAAGHALRAALAARGIPVSGRVLAGVAPAGAVPITSAQSPRLAEIVFYTNRWSVNWPPELMLKYLGARFGGAGSTAAGVAVVRETLHQIGIPLDGFAMYDGSGLSRANRMSARTVGALLDRMLADPGSAALRDSLAVAGGPGTLFRRLAWWPTRGNVRGKTGLLRGVRAMAGWATAADGVLIVYVVMFNGARSAGALTAPLDLVAGGIARYPNSR